MGPGECSASIDELLDRAVRAINEGDRATAATLAEQVLDVDRGNPEAEDLLAAPDRYGEIRRLTIMFADLVDSTALSTRIEPETYRAVVSRYQHEVSGIVGRYEGHITSMKGDGLLAVFGHPKAHENDVRRAVAAGLDITRAVAQLSERAEQRFGVAINVRVGIHHGLVYLDIGQDDVYGFAVNLTSRISGLAEPGTVAVTDAVAPLISDGFELSTRPPAPVKGVDGLIGHHQVLAERPQSLSLTPLPLIGRYRERSWLEQTWQQAREGVSTIPGVAFRGEAGIGKTRLARAAAELVEESGGTVIELRGSPLHTDIGLHPVRRLLERRCGITRLTNGAERLRSLEAELRAYAMDPVAEVPLLAPVLGVGPEHGYQPVAAEGRALHGMIGATVHRYVLACLDGSPGLIIAEDVHWYDPSTIELLNSILTAADGRLLVVLTGREGAWLRTDWPVTLFELTPLTDEESDALIDALNPAVTEAQRAAVRKRCDGVPFYIEHVAAGLDETEHERQVPEALYEPLSARLHTHTDVVPVVEAAAVIGRSGDLALLHSVVEGVADVDGVVAQLVKARVFESARHPRLAIPPRAAPRGGVRIGASPHATGATRPGRPCAGQGGCRRGTGLARDCGPLRTGRAIRRRRGGLSKRFRGRPAPRRSGGGACMPHRRTQPASPLRRRTRAGPHGNRPPARARPPGGCRARQHERGGTGRSRTVPGTGERRQHELELFTTLTALIGYYVPRAELRRAHELLDSLSGRVTKDRPWSYPVIAFSMGSVIWLEGEFTAARGHLLQALADPCAADPRELDSGWWVASDPITTAHAYLALTHMVFGDLNKAKEELTEAVRRCDGLGYPQNGYNRAHTYFKQIWVALEAGQLEEAAALAAGLRRCADESGLDLWRFVSGTEHAAVKAVAALNAGADAPTLAALAANIATRIDASRLMHLNVYLTFHDSIIGRLLIAAGQSEKARERLEMSLQHAQETGMHFHDAELMRLRAHTLTEPQQQRAALADAFEFARKQSATLFELRCLLDSFDLFGDSDRSALANVVSRFPGDARWAEYARAQELLSSLPRR